MKSDIGPNRIHDPHTAFRVNRLLCWLIGTIYSVRLRCCYQWWWYIPKGLVLCRVYGRLIWLEGALFWRGRVCWWKHDLQHGWWWHFNLTQMFEDWPFVIGKYIIDIRTLALSYYPRIVVPPARTTGTMKRSIILLLEWFLSLYLDMVSGHIEPWRLYF